MACLFLPLKGNGKPPVPVMAIKGFDVLSDHVFLVKMESLTGHDVAAMRPHQYRY